MGTSQSKTATPKKPAAKSKPAKATAKKPAAAKTAAVKKPAAPRAKAASEKKPAAPKASTRVIASAPSLEQRHRMIQEAAYYIAEKNGFAGGTMDYWAVAEAQIANMLSGKKKN